MRQWLKKITWSQLLLLLLGLRDFSKFFPPFPFPVFIAFLLLLLLLLSSIEATANWILLLRVGSLQSQRVLTVSWWNCVSRDYSRGGLSRKKKLLLPLSRLVLVPIFSFFFFFFCYFFLYTMFWVIGAKAKLSFTLIRLLAQCYTTASSLFDGDKSVAR